MLILRPNTGGLLSRLRLPTTMVCDVEWTQNRAHFVSENLDEAKSLKRFGEPGRTRTSNPLIKSQLLYH